MADALNGVDERAGSFFRRGVLAFKRAADPRRGLASLSELWQKAADLFRGTGEEGRAREIEESLVGIYEKQRTFAGEEEAVPEGRPFSEWSTFFTVGCFGFGGPMAVFSLLEEELVRKRGILSDEDFLEGAVLGDILPGPVTMDIVSYTGYRLNEWRGAAIATLVFILPSFVLMIGLAVLYNTYSLTPRVESVLKCLGAAVTGLIISVGMRLGEKEIRDFCGVGILVWAFASTLVFKIDIVAVVLLAGAVGTLLYLKGDGA